MKIISTFLILVILSSCSITPEQIDRQDLNLPSLDDTIDSTIILLGIPTKNIYYSRTKLSGDELRFYDILVEESQEWENNCATNSYKIVPSKRLYLARDHNLKISRDNANKVLFYVRYDHPELYHLYSTRVVTRDNNKDIIELDIRFFRFPSHKDYKKNMKIITANSDKIIDKINPAMTEAQKVRLIHDEFIKLVRYGGMNAGNASTIEGAFIHFRVICDGFAKAFLYLLQKAGFEGIYIVGTTPQGRHAWNKVKVDGVWYNIDPTWNNPINGSQKDVIHDYFLLGDTEFNTNHTPDVNFFTATLPETSLTNFILKNFDY